MAIAGVFPDRPRFPARSRPPRSACWPIPRRWPGEPPAIRSACSPASPACPRRRLSAMTGRILPVFSFILPLWLVRSMVSWRGHWEVLPAPGRQRRRSSPGCSSSGPTTWRSAWSTSSPLFSPCWSMVVFLKIWQPRAIVDRTTAEAARRPRRRHSLAGQCCRDGRPSSCLRVDLPVRPCRASKGYLRSTR